jgi:hypothetical protein
MGTNHSKEKYFEKSRARVRQREQGDLFIVKIIINIRIEKGKRGEKINGTIILLKMRVVASQKNGKKKRE